MFALRSLNVLIPRDELERLIDALEISDSLRERNGCTHLDELLLSALFQSPIRPIRELIVAVRESDASTDPLIGATSHMICDSVRVPFRTISHIADLV